MKLVATIKLKIPRYKFLDDMSSTFLKAVQLSIDKGFQAKISNRYKLHHLVYKDLRKILPSNFAIQAIGKASGILKGNKFRVKPHMKSCPISFNRQLFRFSFNSVKISTFKILDRQEISIDIPEYYWKYLDWRYQVMEVIKDNKGKMFLHITFSREVNPNTSTCSNETVGIDLGVNNLAVCSNGRIFTGYKTKIMQYQYLRRKLQRKGTKSAKRLLKKISGRQKRYMRWVNHNVSKEIVSFGDIFVLENLKGIQQNRNRFMNSRINKWYNYWSFNQLQTFIRHKAEREGKRVVFVSPYMTSKTCSNCGQIGTRYFDSFSCKHCDFSSQSDFNASCNLRRHPVIVPNNLINEVKGQSTTATDI